MILYVNSCVREGSRTDKLARALLGKMGEYTEIVLEDADKNLLIGRGSNTG